MAGNDGASHPFDKLRTGLRAFTWTEGQAIRPLYTKLGISPTTFYATLAPGGSRNDAGSSR